MYRLWLKVCFVGYKYSYSCFLLISTCMKYLFPSLHFQSMCVLRAEVSLFSAVYSWSCLFVCLFFRFSHSMSFDWSITPFTFKVIFDRYVLNAILLIVFEVFCGSL